ncbi:MAG: CoA pyrophosphatase [Bacteroidales bacterium]|jgi:8-oxo-dGTP pyrophosphatase MutT (NUDIX family)|nr:CoA pyrophosphatase [Bacteroidales bacterium]
MKNKPELPIDQYISKIHSCSVLPGEEAHIKMAPGLRTSGTTNAQGAFKSAVLICLFEQNNSLYCIYTKRTVQKRDKHSGQISFPGGRYETKDENLRQTAIRECFEEIGVSAHESNISLQLSDIYIPVSNYIVSPFVTFLPTVTNTYEIQKAEVEEVLEIPVELLMQKEHIQQKTVFKNNQEITIPYYSFNKHEIWGATAMITAELIDILRS